MAAQPGELLLDPRFAGSRLAGQVLSSQIERVLALAGELGGCLL